MTITRTLHVPYTALQVLYEMLMSNQPLFYILLHTALCSGFATSLPSVCEKILPVAGSYTGSAFSVPLGFTLLPFQ